jgi:membrane carboxypeptidase/penicillin-binding protein
MITETELKWIRMAMGTDMSPMQMAKTYRVIAQIFQKASDRIEMNLVDKVDDRLYNTNTETKERRYA